MKLMRIGSDYGGWVVPIDLLSENSICYCAGAGEDVSFDVGLIETFNCNVYAFDPTPRAIKHVQQLKENASLGIKTPINNDPNFTYQLSASRVNKFHFSPYGLYGEDQAQRFYEPIKMAHVSHSIVNLQQTDKFFEAPCKTLSTIMRELQHDHLDLLKLDIEGAQHSVLDNILQGNIRPKVLCVEFDEAVMRAESNDARRYIKKLQKAGYGIFHVKKWNLTFVYQTQPDEIWKIWVALKIFFRVVVVDPVKWVRLKLAALWAGHKSLTHLS